MDAERIEFISAYCDRWCERCAFTDRCSAFACQAAIAMCGDFAEGIQLAVGRPKSAGGNDEPPIGGAVDGRSRQSDADGGGDGGVRTRGRMPDARPIHGEEGDEDDPVQNDWNGSAKVALISIERSIDAWDEVPSSGLRRSV
jgi:hypothetical protein